MSAVHAYLAARSVAEGGAVPHFLDDFRLKRFACRGNGLVLGHVGQESQPVRCKSIGHRCVV
jgi:DNA-directed RNA polymerase subunit N (RpoN/RPB10)